MFIDIPFNHIFKPRQRSSMRHVLGLCTVLVIPLSQEPIDGSRQTWVMYVSWRANKIIRFWGSEVKGQRARYAMDLFFEEL